MGCICCYVVLRSVLLLLTLARKESAIGNRRSRSVCWSTLSLMRRPPGHVCALVYLRSTQAIRSWPLRLDVTADLLKLHKLRYV